MIHTNDIEKKPIRVLVVDDSAIARKVIKNGLDDDLGIEVVATASDAFAARKIIAEISPQVITLDVDMPRMDGVEFLRRLMPNYPLPVVVVSSLTAKGGQTTLDALEAGAVDFVTKPCADTSDGLRTMMAELRTKVKIASTVDVSYWKYRQPPSSSPLSPYGEPIVAIGASTGGTQALTQLVSRLPKSCPGIVIVQHMPANFTALFAQRLDREATVIVKEAEDGTSVVRGQVLIAPGGKQLRVCRDGSHYTVHCRGENKVNGHCPSVDVLFSSVARCAGADAIGVILTGMGADGAAGLLRMRRAGARTIGQDEQSCVVYGMPQAAKECGAVEREVPIDLVAPLIVELTAQIKR